VMEMEWSPRPGVATVRIDGARPEAPIQRVDLLVNDRVVATAMQAPYEFLIQVPQEEHWVRARATYRSAGTEVIVETPLAQNPWWPYAGP
jgi:hypothetical protein